MSILYNGDCLEEMKQIDDNSIDLIFTDLPYGQTACKWDCCIDLDKMWDEFMRIKKINTPIFFTCTTKFGVNLINSAPKKCPFRYDIIWEKSSPCGFLSARKMPMRKHEMIYVFYEKLPLYDLSSHNYSVVKKEGKGRLGNCYADKDGKVDKAPVGKYDPPLPTSVVKQDCYDKDKKDDSLRKGHRDGKYDPPLPNSILKVNSKKGNHPTEKPIDLMKWVFKYYSKEGDTVLDCCMGSGSTGVAAAEMNRLFIGIEKDPEIYEVAFNRINPE